jgi:hypothetical protein
MLLYITARKQESLMKNATQSKNIEKLPQKGHSKPKIENLDVLSKESNLSNQDIRCDPNFESELEYNGYDDIVEFDNDEYNANAAEKGDGRLRELNFKGRKEDKSISTEENVVDKQENRS